MKINVTMEFNNESSQRRNNKREKTETKTKTKKKLTNDKK